jgi:hypothetical protein
LIGRAGGPALGAMNRAYVSGWWAVVFRQAD